MDTSLETVARQRLVQQQIARPRLRDPAALVEWMAAVQAQDYFGALWAVGLRLEGATAAEVEAAVADGRIVRTWPMRGTLHFVPAADVRSMLRLLAPRAVARAAGRHRQLGLDAGAFARGRRLLTRALRGGVALTRGEAYAALARGGISPEGQRGIHVLGHLAQQGVVCLGPRRGRQPTFVLLDEWVRPSPEPARDEFLAALAVRYFRSHGPATAHDFAWWTGLGVTAARAAIADAGAELRAEGGDGRPWIRAADAEKAPRRAATATTPAVLLPIWDEYLVAYKDRDAAVLHARARQARLQTVGSALVVIDGRARGTWRRTVGPSRVRIAIDLWDRVTTAERRDVEEAAARYGRFVGLEAEADFSRSGGA